MIKTKFTIAMFAMCFTSILFAQNVENEAESKSCLTQISACGAGFAAAGKAVGNTLKNCKPLRECKKEVREEKRDCKKEARADKKSCKDDCRDKYGHGKDYRDCKKGCGEVKREEKSECKETKKDDIETCRDDFKTPECTTARKLMGGAVAGGIPACGLAVKCIADNSSSSK